MKTLVLATVLLNVFMHGAAWADDPSVGAGPEVTVTAVTQALPTLPQFRIEKQYYDVHVPEWSNGRVTINGNTWVDYSVTGSDVLRLVRQGQIDIGMASLATAAGDVPFLEVADLAGLMPTIEAARAVAEATRGEMDAQLEQFGIKIIGIYPFPGNTTFCREPMTSLADMSGRKIRTFGPSLNDLFQGLGASGVSVAYTETYSALERGVVDCAVTAALSGNAAKWHEVTTALYTQPVSWGTAGYFVNLDWWNRLDSDVRDFIAATYKKIEDDLWTLGADGMAEGIACYSGDEAACKNGTVVAKDTLLIVPPAESDTELLKTAVQGVLAGWVSRCGAECGTLYNQLVAPVVGVTYTP